MIFIKALQIWKKTLGGQIDDWHYLLNIVHLNSHINLNEEFSKLPHFCGKMSSSHLTQTCFIISVIKADRSYFQHRIATGISPTNSKESPEGIQYLQFRHVLEKQVPCRVLSIHCQLPSYINCFALHSAPTVIVLLPSACAVQYCLQVTCFLWKRKPKSPAARLPCVSGTGHGGGGGGGRRERWRDKLCANRSYDLGQRYKYWFRTLSLLGISDWGVTPYFRPENVILHTLFQTYPASRGFSLAWLLSITKSFASLVSLVVGLSQERRTKQNNYTTDGERFRKR